MKNKIRKIIKAKIKQLVEQARPDYPDVDGDGNTKEPMAKAFKDKKAKKESQLRNPKKADLDKDGKLSSYEKTRGANIEKNLDEEGSDIAVDSDQIAYAVDETRADYTPPPMGMGGEEKEDEEQDEYDKGWYRESLKEAATKLGYLKKK
tara:strand:- start:7 stop:453 length:447 start_codon:yes stop_codon:yes gene_type:complete